MQSSTLYAKNAEVDKRYVLFGDSTRSFVIKEICKVTDNTEKESVTRVNIVEDSTKLPSYIAGDTIITEYVEEYHGKLKNKVEKGYQDIENVRDNVVKDSKIQKISKETSKMAQNKNPRSKVIDKLLAAIPKGQVPNWAELVQEVIKAGCAKEGEEKKVIFQAKIRYKWYTVDGKSNPFATDPA